MLGVMLERVVFQLDRTALRSIGGFGYDDHSAFGALLNAGPTLGYIAGALLVWWTSARKTAAIAVVGIALAPLFALISAPHTSVLVGGFAATLFTVGALAFAGELLGGSPGRLSRMTALVLGREAVSRVTSVVWIFALPVTHGMPGFAIVSAWLAAVLAVGAVFYAFGDAPTTIATPAASTPTPPMGPAHHGLAGLLMLAPAAGAFAVAGRSPMGTTVDSIAAILVGGSAAVFFAATASRAKRPSPMGFYALMLGVVALGQILIRASVSVPPLFSMGELVVAIGSVGAGITLAASALVATGRGAGIAIGLWLIASSAIATRFSGGLGFGWSLGNDVVEVLACACAAAMVWKVRADAQRALDPA